MITRFPPLRLPRETTPRHLIFTLVALTLTPGLQAQNTLDKAGLGITAGAAYSMRLLSSSYAGKALQVRRSSDNTTQDIGFTAGGDLDTAALKTFVGATDSGRVTAWYDQSGNGLNLTQASQGAQPLLINNGVINREGGQPFLRFYGSGTTYQSLNLAADMTTVGHVSAVMRLMTGGADGFILSHTTQYYWHSNPYTALINSTFASASVQGGNAWENGKAYTPTTMPWPSALTIAEIEPTTPSTGTTWNNIGSDRNQFHDISNGGGYGELLLFPAALSSANRMTLEVNQNNYFQVAVLPVTWLSFTADAQKDAVVLQWQTASEQNSKDFIVQYSTNGETFANLATLPAAGNSTAASSYSYRHTTPQTGDNYYRIAETDLDGKTIYSKISTVHINTVQTEFQVLQNPVTDGLLRVKVNTPTTLSLYSMDGKLLRRIPSNAGTSTFSLDGYPRGAYLLTGATTRAQVLVQ